MSLMNRMISQILLKADDLIDLLLMLINMMIYQIAFKTDDGRLFERFNWIVCGGLWHKIYF